MTKRSADHLRSIVSEKHNDVRQNLDSLIEAIATNDKARVQAANQTLRNSLHALGAVVARGDWPTWLRDLIQRVDAYETNHSNGVSTWKAHLLTLMRTYDKANAYQWFTADDEEEESDFDLDQIIANARDAHKIDDLFGKLISVLESLAQCDELDSVKACDDLNRVISILRRARAGSFMSQVATWAFARRFLPNLFKEYVKQSKVVGLCSRRSRRPRKSWIQLSTTPKMPSARSSLKLLRAGSVPTQLSTSAQMRSEPCLICQGVVHPTALRAPH